MMEQYLGEDAFRDGVRSYVRKQAYGNATAADLRANLGTATGRDVGTLIDPWITTFGLPVIDVSATCAAGRHSLALAHHRFFIEPGRQSSQLLSIPVGVDVGGKTTFTLLDGATATADGGACARSAIGGQNLAMATNGEITTEYGSEFAFYDVAIVALRGRQPEAAWAYFKARESDMAAKMAVFERPLVLSEVTPLYWNAAPVADLDTVIDAMALPPELAARAKHAVDLRLVQRDRIVPLVNAALGPGTRGS